MTTNTIIGLNAQETAEAEAQLEKEDEIQALKDLIDESQVSLEELEESIIDWNREIRFAEKEKEETKKRINEWEWELDQLQGEEVK